MKKLSLYVFLVLFLSSCGSDDKKTHIWCEFDNFYYFGKQTGSDHRQFIEAMATYTHYAFDKKYIYYDWDKVNKIYRQREKVTRYGDDWIRSDSVKIDRENEKVFYMLLSENNMYKYEYCIKIRLPPSKKINKKFSQKFDLDLSKFRHRLF